MRSGQQNNKRSRGRGSNNNNSNNNNNNNNYNRKGSNPLTRSYDSSGPDVKIRGTAQYIAEKYAGLARDAQSSGDRVMAENYLQHAEHYNRIVATAQSQMQERFQREERQDYNDRDADDNDVDNDAEESGVVTAGPVSVSAPIQAPAPKVIDGSGPQPVIEGTPVEVSIEEESAGAAQPAAGGGREKAPARRRTASNRPRREPRTSGASDKAEEGEKPAASEAPAAPALEPASE